MSSIDSIIRSRERDLGGFSVRRVLPAGSLATLLPGRPVELRASSTARCMVLAGETEVIPLPDH